MLTTSLKRLCSILLIAWMLIPVAGAALALDDVWSGYRGPCLGPGWDLKVQSYASGTVKHFKNGVQTGQWSNSGLRWRTTYQGWQYQEVIVSATVELQTVLANTCVCLSGQCTTGAET